jgi:hypothetical protein
VLLSYSSNNFALQPIRNICPLSCRHHTEGITLNRTTRKALNTIADHNEDAAIALMRAAERTGDEVLRQQMLRVIHRLNQDATDLRALRDDAEPGSRKRA